MQGNVLLEKCRAGKTVIGLGVMYGAPGIVEGMCKDVDFAWIDGQHGLYGYDSLLATMRAADAVGVDALMRVPGHEYGVVGPIADLAPSAIMIPMVNNAEEAENVVANLTFAPRGRRSFGGRRVIDLYSRDYYRDRPIMLVPQIETVEAVNNVEEIVAVDGVDGVFFGPDDVRIQLGLPMDSSPLDTPQLRDAMVKTAAAANAAGKTAGTVSGTPEAFDLCLELGYRMIAGGGDVQFIRTSAVKRVAEMREAMGAKGVSAAQPGSSIYGG